MKLKRVEDHSHFRSLIKETKDAWGNLGRSNLYLLGQAQKELVACGLHYAALDGAICFFESQKERLKMYYMASRSLESMHIPVGGVVAEFIEREGPRLDETRAFLSDSGFSQVGVYDEMTCPALKAPAETGERSRDGVAMAKESDIDGILSLWEEQLNTWAHPLPSGEELLRSIEKQSIIVVRDGDCRVIAAMSRKIENSLCFIEYAAVASSCQSRGLGGRMLESCHKEEGVSRLRLFVDHGDERAVGFYKKNGFSATGKKLVQMYK